MHSEVTSDLQDFNDEMAAKLQTPVFPTFGMYPVIGAKAYMLSHTHRKSVGALQIINKALTHTLHFSDVAPVNYFPRNTTSTANQFQWVFDTQSAGWKVRHGTYTTPY